MNVPATHVDPDCPLCFGQGRVCDAHPFLAWGQGLRGGYFPVDRVCWCGAEPRPCACGSDLEPEPPASRRSDFKDMLKWALVAAAITLVFGTVLNLLDAWL